MSELLETFIIFIIVLILIFIIDYLINKKKLYLLEHNGLNKKNKKKKIKPIGEIDYLVVKFNLNKDKINLHEAIIWISFINAFIISFTSSIITLIPLKMLFQLLIAFVILFSLIYALYEIYGRHLKNIEEKNLIIKITESNKKNIKKEPKKDTKKTNKNKKE